MQSRGFVEFCSMELHLFAIDKDLFNFAIKYELQSRLKQQFVNVCQMNIFIYLFYVIVTSQEYLKSCLPQKWSIVDLLPFAIILFNY